MRLAYLFLTANWAATTADYVVSVEKNASPYAHAQQAVESHFQLGSGAGSESQPHGNENNEPAISLGHPHSSSVSREYRNTEVKERNLQDIQFKSISGLFSKILNILASNGIPLFYAIMWPISVMLIFAYIHMLPRAGDLDLPPRFDPADNRYRFSAWIRDVRDWVSQTRRPVHYQALDLVSVLDGPARGVAGQLHAEELVQGGYLNGLQYDPVTYLLLCLARHYGRAENQIEPNFGQDQPSLTQVSDGGNQARLDPPQRVVCSVCSRPARECLCEINNDINLWWDNYQRENPGDTDFTREDIVRLRHWIAGNDDSVPAPPATQETVTETSSRVEVTESDAVRTWGNQLAAVQPPDCLPRYPDRACPHNSRIWRGSLDMSGNERVNEWCFISRMPGLPLDASPKLVELRNLIEYCSLLQKGHLCALDLNHLQLAAWFRADPVWGPEVCPERTQYPDFRNVSTLSSCFRENSVFVDDTQCDVLVRNGFKPYEGSSRAFDTIVCVELFGFHCEAEETGMTKFGVNCDLIVSVGSVETLLLQNQ